MDSIKTHPISKPAFHFYQSNDGERLREERQKICSELNASSSNADELREGWQERDSPSEETLREVEYTHRELLHERLRRIDDALDRLIAGSYGRCSECGEDIEARRLSADPAVSLCYSCQTAIESGVSLQML
jgi:DnaK suppressor protein